MKGKFSLRMKAVESDLDFEKLLGSYQVTMQGMAIPGKQNIMSQGMKVEQIVKSSENIIMQCDYSLVCVKIRLVYVDDNSD